MPILPRRQFLACAGVTALQAATEPGFVSLFDGKTLAGWSVREGPESAFHVADGAITVHRSANFPAWLRYDRVFENFDFRGEFYLKGWMDSGIYLHAPEHGRNTWTGMEIKLFHQKEEKPSSNSCGAVFPLAAPKLVNVRNQGEWNSIRVLMDWPSLKVWINEALVQDLDLDQHPDLRFRLRRGYLGIQSLSYPIRFRNLQIKELAGREQWESMFETASDISRWKISEGKPRYEAVGDILRLEGLGHIAFEKLYRDFEFQAYIRTSRWQNGGILFRSLGGGTRSGKNYEIQLHNVEGAHFPTGSLYHHKRAAYPRIRDEEWWLCQLIVKGSVIVVRINGENVLEYDQLENTGEGMIELQAHQEGTWAEFKQVRVKKI